MRRGVWAVLLVLYAIIPLIFVGKPIPTCLGLGDQTTCVDAWKATLGPVDRLVEDLPWPVTAIAIFVGLLFATYVADTIWRRITARMRIPRAE